jgi:hypothetical protein
LWCGIRVRCSLPACRPFRNMKHSGGHNAPHYEYPVKGEGILPVLACAVH